LEANVLIAMHTADNLNLFGLITVQKTGHKIATQDRHPEHHSVCNIVFYKL